MQHIYEFEFVPVEEGYFVYLFDFDTATQGDDLSDAVHMASDLIRFVVEDYILRGKALPVPTFCNEPLRNGRIVAVTAEVNLYESEDFVTATEAAQILGVSAARISHLLRDGLLHGYKERGNSFVTVESVNAYGEKPRKSGRPSLALRA